MKHQLSIYHAVCRIVITSIILLLNSFTTNAEIYRYLGVENGLSNRKVFKIIEDKKGYMWFLTYEGVDRFDGSHFKHYKLIDNNQNLNSFFKLNWLYLDNKGQLWEIGKKGTIFSYNEKKDCFELRYKLLQNDLNIKPNIIDFSYLDKENNIWLCQTDSITLYNTDSSQIRYVKNPINETIVSIQENSDKLFIASYDAIYYGNIQENKLSVKKILPISQFDIKINQIYYEKKTEQLLISTYEKGVYIFNLKTRRITTLPYNFNDVNISSIVPLDRIHLLLATKSKGIFKMNILTHEVEHYYKGSEVDCNKYYGNNITDIYVDHYNRIWIANYPTGVTIRNNNIENYKWFKSSRRKKNSLCNNQVNSIIEDHKHMIWMGTNDGISQYNAKNNTFHCLLSSKINQEDNCNHTFTALCEVEPNIIWAGGYASKIHEINNATGTIRHINLEKEFTIIGKGKKRSEPHFYIRYIYKDANGEIWVTGYYNLVRINLKKRTIKYYNNLNATIVVKDKNRDELWCGTADGLFLLNKKTEEIQKIKLPTPTNYIYTLYQDEKGMLYIGTNGSGLLIYNSKNEEFDTYNTDNSALISNNIYSIIFHKEFQRLILATENGLSSYYLKRGLIKNWTKEQGLRTLHFNANAGINTSYNTFIFGSSNGAIEINSNLILPKKKYKNMIFESLKINGKRVYAEEKHSPLKKMINNTEHLNLKNGENSFSIKVTSINFDTPSDILFSWQLRRYDDYFNKPSNNNVISYSRIPPGTYTLVVKALSNENQYMLYEQREMQITIAPPFLASSSAFVFYIIILLLIGYLIFMLTAKRRNRKISEEKIQFLINAAHEIKTPLSLIKGPLEELRQNFTEDYKDNLNIALRNVETLHEKITHILDFKNANKFSGNLYYTKNQMSNFIEEVCQSYRPYADIKYIDLELKNQLKSEELWFDKEKISAVFYNLISNAIKYTPERGKVNITLYENNKYWFFNIKDSGIGIPKKDHKKVFKLHYRAKNSVNTAINGNGIGLLLVKKIVKKHNGKISLESKINIGTSFTVMLPKENRINNIRTIINNVKHSELEYKEKMDLKNEEKARHKRLLIVEDNKDFREYLNSYLSKDYNTYTCKNGKDALLVISEFKPEIIISDIIMPKMGGDELCHTIKNNIETSHIPIILISSLTTNQSIIKGLKIGADDYITKPFHIDILKAKIENLLLNIRRLQKKYSNLELTNEEETDNENNETNSGEYLTPSNDIDWKFIASIKEYVETNMDDPNFNIDKLCEHLLMSRTSFYNKLKALTGKSPNDYIRIIKLKKAAKLLREGNHTVTEISEMVGFSDTKHFREIFKKCYNINPSKFKKSTEDKHNKKEKTKDKNDDEDE